MEKLQNHSGRNSVLVLRPADVYETTWAWRIAMENRLTPSALILSRQNIKDLPVLDATKSRYEEAEQARKGAYIVSDEENIWGLNSFGFSAPYKVLDNELGFTAENVYKQVKRILG